MEDRIFFFKEKMEDAYRLNAGLQKRTMGHFGRAFPIASLLAFTEALPNP
jgi:hypothetical protein